MYAIQVIMHTLIQQKLFGDRLIIEAKKKKKKEKEKEKEKEKKKKEKRGEETSFIKKGGGKGKVRRRSRF